MATYAKKIFPTLPMGVSHGAPGFKWRTGERYRVLDWVACQYVWNYNQGDVTAYREAVLDSPGPNGVTPMFGLNILNGGVRTRPAPGIAPHGRQGNQDVLLPYDADQVRTYGQAMGPSGCALLMWRYDDAFMANAANKSAFKDVASLAQLEASAQLPPALTPSRLNSRAFIIP